MSFLKSTINQVGRDLGKVVSNEVFKDAHSTPHRIVKNNQKNNSSRQVFAQKKKEKLDNCDKLISFNIAYKADTLITKLSGVYVEMKNLSSEFVEDGYLDSKETTDLFTTIEKFNGKTSDIYDVLTINEQKNEKYIEQVSSLVDKTKEHFKKILTVAIEGCEKKSKHYKNRSESVVGISLKKYTFLHFFWMSKYARGGEKNLRKAIFANLIDIITAFFILSRPVLILTALFTYPNIKKKNKELKKSLSELAELELKRVEEFRKIIQKN
jgi:23S rRNA pseudoU1915 N3-methylase RlmH